MRQISQATTIVAPVGGINAFDAISSMNTDEAIILRNWFPTSYGCTLRRGYVQHAGGMNGLVETIMNWNSATGLEYIFAIDEDGVYDVTSVGDVSGTPDVALTEPKVQHTMLGNAAGTHLIGFNGADDGLWYSEAGWQRLIAGDGTANGTWSGVDPADLIGCTVHQRRLWAVEKDSTQGWYLPPNQIFGVASNFDFGPVFKRGGFLQALSTWTRDSGDGPDDYFIAISSEGEVAVYRGLDPDSADSWSLVGVYFIGETFSRRCFTKYGGDVIILTEYGIISMNSIVSAQGRSPISSTLSLKIQSLISNLTSEGSTRDGWEMMVYPSVNMLLLNVPGVVYTENAQLALNTIKGAWCTLDGMQARTWGSTDDTLFFGSEGMMYRAWEGFQDDVDYNGDNGKDIVASVQQAFSFFNSLGQQKHFKMVRPSLITAGGFSYNIGINTDYTFDEVGAPSSNVALKFGLWDQSNWDEVVWAGGSNSIANWFSVVGIGFSASLTMTLRASSEVTWVSTNWIYELGGPV